ncbi:hypothetical protein F1640_18575 [Novosphingobium sp. NBM11]|uniref:hypothetical protein n=1 Tax=Novosphingobium sp. NBM11 TaxID=2596914 RepID=UPI001891FAEE|nr:hypothetical protein [Novosphingobium sp. NBM11]MBF5091961.1 hypothetical protein [Novosphingobium sp. NBM11]
MNDLFHWIGVVTVAAISIAVLAAGGLTFYGYCIEGRFHTILFQRGSRRLSLASWRNFKGIGDNSYQADDWPIGPRPFYLSYRYSRERRLFLMFGTMSGPRNRVLSGERHPNEDDTL